MTSVRTVNTKRSAKQFARGHRGGDLDHLDARIGQDGVERGRELSGPIADEEPEPPDAIAEVHQEVAGLLGGPGPVRVPGHPQDVQVALADLQHEQN